MKNNSQKFEDIKRIALKLLIATASHNDKDESTSFGEISESWKFAEEFYEYAEQKREENENEK